MVGAGSAQPISYALLDGHFARIANVPQTSSGSSVERIRCSKPQCGPRSINGRSSTTSARQRPSRTCARSTQTALRAQRQRRCRQSRTRSLEREFGTWQAEHRNTLLRGVFRLFLFPWPVVHVWEQEHNATCYHVFPVPKGFRALPKGGRKSGRTPPDSGASIAGRSLPRPMQYNLWLTFDCFKDE